MLRVVVLNILLTVLLLMAVEGCVRVAYPEIGPIGLDAALVSSDRFGDTAGLQPGSSGQVYGTEMAVDGDGFLVYSAANRTAPSWLLLGDSVTMGIGVAADSTFVGRLAASVDSAAVKNPSLVGYGAADYVTVLRALLSRTDLEIRWATVVWCLNDAHDRVEGANDPGAFTRRNVGPGLGFLHRHVRTYQWAKATFADRPRAYLLHDLGFYEDDAFDYADRHLATLRAVADSAQIHLDLVVVPYEPQLRAEARPHDLLPQDRLAEAARRHGIAFHDAAEVFRSVEASASLYRYGDGIHLSERGHARLADFILATR